MAREFHISFAGGENRALSKHSIPPNQAYYAYNIDIDYRRGILYSRRSRQDVFSPSPTIYPISSIYPFYLTSSRILLFNTTYPSILWADSTQLKTLAGGNPLSIFTYGGKAYITNGQDDPFKTDGASTEIVGLPVPTETPTAAVSRLLLNDCEDKTEWTASTHIKKANDDKNYTSGNQSLRLRIGKSFTSGVAIYYDFSTPVDLSSYEQINLQARATGMHYKITQIEKGDIQLLLYDGAGGTGNLLATLNFPTLQYGHWETVSLVFADDPALGDLSSVASMCIYIDNSDYNKKKWYLNVDNIYAGYAGGADSFGFETSEGTLSEQKYKYIFTWETTDGLESSASNESTEVSAQKEKITVSLAFSKPSNATKLYVYRTGGTLSEYHRLEEDGISIGDISTYTYEDTKSDEDILNNIAYHNEDHSPPDKYKYWILRAQRAYGAYISSQPQRRFYSLRNLVWPGVEAWPTTYFDDTGEHQDAITGLLEYGLLLLIFKENGIWALEGYTPYDAGIAAGVSFEGIAERKLAVVKGCIAPKSLVLYDWPIWVWRDGIYYLAGEQENSLGLRTSNMGKYDIFRPIFTEEVNQSYISGACAIIHNNFLYVSLPGLDQSHNTFTLKVDLLSGAYTRLDYGFEAACVDRENNLIIGDYNGNIKYVDSSDNIEAISCIYQTGLIDFGTPALNKQLLGIIIFANTQGRNLTIEIRDIEDNVLKTVTVNTTSLNYQIVEGITKYSLNLSVQRQISLYLSWSGQAGDPPLQIESPITLLWEPQV